MFGVTFYKTSALTNGTTTASLNLVGAQKTIGSPQPKISTIPIPGSDVTLDFTEAFGGVHYNNRTITLVFLSLHAWSAQMAQDSTVKNALHGQKFYIVFSDDANYYYVGRVTVGDWEYYRGAGRVVVTIDAEPYKCKKTETTKSSAITTSGTVTLTNGRKPVVPYISTDAAVTLAWSGYSVALAAGNDQIVPQLVLEEGTTTITVTGTATVSFRYREGSL